jgi:hypothetical protein
MRKVTVSRYQSLQSDEDIDISDLAHFLTFIRFEYEKLLFANHGLAMPLQMAFLKNHTGF